MGTLNLQTDNTNAENTNSGSQTGVGVGSLAAQAQQSLFAAAAAAGTLSITASALAIDLITVALPLIAGVVNLPMESQNDTVFKLTAAAPLAIALTLNIVAPAGGFRDKQRITISSTVNITVAVTVTTSTGSTILPAPLIANFTFIAVGLLAPVTLQFDAATNSLLAV